MTLSEELRRLDRKVVTVAAHLNGKLESDLIDAVLELRALAAKCDGKVLVPTVTHDLTTDLGTARHAAEVRAMMLKYYTGWGDTRDEALSDLQALLDGGS